MPPFSAYGKVRDHIAPWQMQYALATYNGKLADTCDLPLANVSPKIEKNLLHLRQMNNEYKK